MVRHVLGAFAEALQLPDPVIEMYRAMQRRIDMLESRVVKATGAGASVPGCQEGEDDDDSRL